MTKEGKCAARLLHKNFSASRRLCDTSDMTRINHEEGDAETADVANLGEAVGTLSLSPAASEPAAIDPSDESFSRGSETSSGPTIRLFIGDLHRSTTEVRWRLHVEALSNNAPLWRSYDLAEAPCYPMPPNMGCTPERAWRMIPPLPFAGEPAQVFRAVREC